MAEIAPFRGIRYNLSKVGDLSRVTSPPYDVISPEDRVRYHKLHPNNFVRLILGEEFETDTASDNRFTRAAKYLEQWMHEGVLAQDPEPAIYVYRQRFEQDGRARTVSGLVPAVRLHDYSDNVILPHETTLAKPKSQLIELMRRTRANLDSIYGLYGDEEGVLDGIIRQAQASEPLAEAVDGNGVAHTLWAITDSGGIEQIIDFFADRRIAIADGHHRYETALNYRDEMRRGRTDAVLPSDYTLMTLVNVHQPDIIVYPTHRAVGGLAQPLIESLDSSLEEDFVIEASSRDSLLADMARRQAIGIYRAGSAQTLKMKDSSENKITGCKAACRLELNILHQLILEQILGIDEENLRNQTNIIYTRDAREAMAMVDRGDRQAAFLLNHIPVRTVLDVATAGERMPQKATYFYPKLLSGLVLRKMDG